MILITGGAGFIGSNFVLDWFLGQDEPIVNLDKLTYAGNLQTLDTLKSDTRHHFIQGDINNSDLLATLLRDYRPRAILHFAAESHVDRSIHGPSDFIQTNIVGTFQLLQAALIHWQTLPPQEQQAFRFVHISTDEVYGTLNPNAPAFTETTPFQPNSPYSASKAASDHLVRAWHHTYQLPIIITHCSNNYGPFQFPEKLIPLMIFNALTNKPLPVYGDGQQVRDWLYVNDHCAALRQILTHGQIGETYNIGGWNEKTNLEVVHTLCQGLDKLHPRQDKQSYVQQICFVQDRPGHDRRYAIDARKLERDLGWKPQESFESGIQKTLDWYLTHTEWVQNVTSGAYRQWMAQHYGRMP